MVYQWKPLRADREAVELARFLRGLIADTGMTLRMIADAAFLSRSALSQNCDGRWRKWNVIERWITALYAAADVAEIDMRFTREQAMALAHEHWKVADARHREGRSHRRTSTPDSAASNPAGATASGAGRRLPAQRPRTLADLGRNGPPSPPGPPPARTRDTTPNQRRRPADNPVAVHRPGLENPVPISDPHVWDMITGRVPPTPELISRAINSCPAEDLPALARIFAQVLLASQPRDLR
jgi:hypothetical protein